MTRRRRRTLRKRKGGVVIVPAVPKDASGVEYQIYYANPISDVIGYSTILQLETPKFKAVTTNNPSLNEKRARAIKIGSNFAFKFFYLTTTSDKKWYVMLNMQVMKNWFSSKHNAKNMEIFQMKPDAMWFDPKVQNNITNKPNNNDIVLRFTSKYVKGETSDQIEIDLEELIQIPGQFSDPIVHYLQINTFSKEVLKEEANNFMFDSLFKWLGF